MDSQGQKELGGGKLGLPSEGSVPINVETRYRVHSQATADGSELENPQRGSTGDEAEVQVGERLVDGGVDKLYHVTVCAASSFERRELEGSILTKTQAIEGGRVLRQENSSADRDHQSPH